MKLFCCWLHSNPNSRVNRRTASSKSGWWTWSNGWGVTACNRCSTVYGELNHRNSLYPNRSPVIFTLQRLFKKLPLLGSRGKESHLASDAVRRRPCSAALVDNTVQYWVNSEVSHIANGFDLIKDWRIEKQIGRTGAQQAQAVQLLPPPPSVKAKVTLTDWTRSRKFVTADSTNKSCYVEIEMTQSAPRKTW